MTGCEAHAHCQNGHVRGYVTALSNQIPIFNAMLKQTNERTHRLEKIKYIKDINCGSITVLAFMQ